MPHSPYTSFLLTYVEYMAYPPQLMSIRYPVNREFPGIAPATQGRSRGEDPLSL